MPPSDRRFPPPLKLRRTRCRAYGAKAGVRASAVALALVCASATYSAGQSFSRMADEKQWTTENLKIDVDGSYCYNFGKGSLMLNRHRDGEKPRAFAVRCIRDDR
jgi:hypothetical protein